jgi:hypothetical protein
MAQYFLHSDNIGLWEVKLQLFNSPIGNPSWPDLEVYGAKDNICEEIALEEAELVRGHRKHNSVKLLSNSTLAVEEK